MRGNMAVQFEESRRYLDDVTLKILLLVLVATDVFAVICFAMGWMTEAWEVIILIALTVVGALIAYFLRFSFKVEDGDITVSFVRTRRIPQKRILDVKKGDIDILRDYSGWGHGTKVRYSTYALPGIDGAVSIKLGGKEVITVTTEHPDELYDLIYSLRRLD